MVFFCCFKGCIKITFSLCIAFYYFYILKIIRKNLTEIDKTRNKYKKIKNEKERKFLINFKDV